MKFQVPKKVLSPRRLIKSFGYAFNGLAILVKEEQNYLVHLTVGLIAIILGFWYRIASWEWIALILSIQVVLTLETVNTAIENLTDFVSTERSVQIMRIKDLAAASVLIAAIAAGCVGLIIFVPKICGF